MAVIFNVAGTLPKIRKGKKSKKRIGSTSIVQSAPKSLKNYARSKGLGIKKLTYRFQGLSPKTGYALTKEYHSNEYLYEMVTIKPLRSGINKWSVTIHTPYSSSFQASDMKEVIEQLRTYKTNFNFKSTKLIKI